MPAPLSLDLRQRILDALLRGDTSIRAIALRFAVSHDTVERIKRRHELQEPITPRSAPGATPRILEEHHALFHLWIAHDPTTSQGELAARYAEATGRTVSARTAGRLRTKLGYTLKKRR